MDESRSEREQGRDGQSDRELSGWKLYGSVILAAGILGLGSTILPMGGDHGNYAYAAWAWIDGAAPYRDVLVWRPPITVFVYGIAHAIFGHSMVGIRLIDLLWQAVTACVLAGIVHEETRDRRASVFTGVGYALIYYHFDFWHSAQTDGWLALPMALGVWWAVRATDRADWRPMLLAGVAVGVATFLKYPGLAAALPVAYLIVTRQRSRIWSLSGTFAAGLALVGVTIVAWLLVSGAWGAFLHHHLEVLPRYVQFSSSGRGWSGVVQFGTILVRAPMMQVLFWSGVVGTVGWLVWGIRRISEGSAASEEELGAVDDLGFRLLVVAWLFAAFLVCYTQGKFFEYHFLPLAAPVAIMGGVAFRQFTRRLPAYAGVAVFVAIVSVISSMPKSNGAPSLRDWWSVSSGEVSMVEYWMSSEFIRPNVSVRENILLVRWLLEQTDSKDRVFIWGRVPMVNYWAQRKSATRYIYNYPFRYPWSAPERNEDLLEGLRDTKPEIFVISSQDATYRASGSARDSRQVFRDFDKLNTWVQKHYRSVDNIGRFHITRRVSSDS